MPWVEESVMSQRQRMVEQLLLPNANVSKICKAFNVSRKTAYKWLERYKEGGLDALQDVTRARRNQSQKVAPAIETLIVDTHKEYPYWGPKKLRDYLKYSDVEDVHRFEVEKIVQDLIK